MCRRRGLRSIAPVLLVLAAVGSGCVDGLSGGTLLVERVEPVEQPLELDESLTEARVPAFARLLDEAHQSGRASVSDRDDYGPMLQYLDEQAKAAGAASFNSPPFNNTVEWRGDHFQIFLLMDG